jgi:hypothetical protein
MGEGMGLSIEKKVAYGKNYQYNTSTKQNERRMKK